MLAPSLPSAATEVLLNAVVSATPNATDAVSGVATSSCGAVATNVLGTFLYQLHSDGQRRHTETTSLSYTVVNQLSGTGTILFGTKPPAAGGFGTFAFAGGTFAQLLSASGCPQATAGLFFYNKPDGAFATWIPRLNCGSGQRRNHCDLRIRHPGGDDLYGPMRLDLGRCK